MKKRSQKYTDSCGRSISWINFSSFNPFPSFPSVTTDDRKQFQCLNVILKNKTGPLFFESAVTKIYGFMWTQHKLDQLFQVPIHFHPCHP